jgi:hypothetical protein
MTVKCCKCDKLVERERIRESSPEKSLCKRCFVKWLERMISYLEDDLYVMREQLRECLDGKDEESESEDDNYEYPIVDGETLEGCKVYNSDDDYPPLEEDLSNCNI